MLTIGSLFSGIGGLDLGLERAGMRIRWQVENDRYCNQILEKHWPAIRRYGDIRSIEWADVERVDLVCGGFPCQPVSNAGNKRGDKDERWLWPEFVRCLREIRPGYALVENVPGLFTIDDGRIARGVFGDLAVLGYDAQWGIVSASDVGAPHLRKRIFILANAQRLGFARPSIPIFQREPCEKDSYACREGTEMADPEGSEREGSLSSWSGRAGTSRGGDRGREDKWPIEPGVCRVVNGIPNQLDRIRVLGNAVVPQVAEAIGRMIAKSVSGKSDRGE